MLVVKRSKSAPQNLCMPTEEELKKALAENQSSSSSFNGDSDSSYGTKQFGNNLQVFNKIHMAKNKSAPITNEGPVVKKS